MSKVYKLLSCLCIVVMMSACSDDGHHETDRDVLVGVWEPVGMIKNGRCSEFSDQTFQMRFGQDNEVAICVDTLTYSMNYAVDDEKREINFFSDISRTKTKYTLPDNNTLHLTLLNAEYVNIIFIMSPDTDFYLDTEYVFKRITE